MIRTTLRLAALLLASIVLVAGLSAPSADAQNFPQWDPQTQYAEGDIVLFGNTLFVANEANQGEQPGSSAAWDLYPPRTFQIVVAAAGAGGPSEENQALLDAIVAFRDGPSDEVLGVAESADDATAAAAAGGFPASPPLALTGNDVSVPLAIGSTLIGLGSLLVLTTRKRANQD